MSSFRLSGMVKKILSDKSEKNLLINVLMAFGVKGLSLILSVFATPLYIKYFDNNTALGVWYTVLSVLSWISICDLGLSNGLRNKLTEAIAQSDEENAKKYISSTYAILILIMFPITVVGDFWIWTADLNRLLNISENILSATTLRYGITILFTGITINFVFKTINSVFYAIQKASVNNVLALVSSFIPFLYILFFKGSSTEDNFISLAIVHSLAMLLPLFVASIMAFKTSKYKYICPSVHYVNVKTAKNMFNFGMQFFVAQIFFLILMSTNELIITSIYSADHVVQYNIYYRLFSFVGSLFMLALTPMWSKITMDVANGNYIKLKQTKTVLYVLAVIAVIAEFLLVPFIQFILDLWLGEDTFQSELGTVLGFAFFGGIYIVNNILTTIANGIGDLKSQIFFYGCGAVLKIPVILLLSRISSDWSVVVWYNGIVLFVFCVYQFYWTEKRVNKMLGEDRTSS